MKPQTVNCPEHGVAMASCLRCHEEGMERGGRTERVLVKMALRCEAAEREREEARELAREGLEWALRLDEGLSISDPKELERFHQFCLRVERLPK